MYVCVQQAACKELGVNDAEKLVPAIQQLLRHMARNYTVEQVGTADVFKLFICNFTVINYVDVQILGKGREKNIFFLATNSIKTKRILVNFHNLHSEGYTH